MTYEHYIKQPMQMVVLRLGLIIAQNPHLMNSLDRNVSQPLSREYSHKPFNNKEMYVFNLLNEYDNIIFTNCTNNESEDNNIIFKYLLRSIPSNFLLFSLINLMLYTSIKPLIPNI